MPAGFRRHLVGKTLTNVRYLYTKLYPQNVDRIVAIDSVTPLHSMNSMLLDVINVCFLFRIFTMVDI